MSTEVAWIGAGIMGAPMAGHLMNAGHNVTVYSRRRESAAGLLEAGATWADTPAAAAAAADVIFTMVGYPADVRAVVLGEDGALAGAKPGSLLIDMTTSEPTLAVEIAAAADAKGVQSIDAPVSGGDVGARNGQLVIMAGGSAEAFARAQPLFDVFGKSVSHCGAAGTGQHTKMTNQIAIASGMVAVCEALVYASAAGLDLEATLNTIGGGAAASFSLATYGPRLLKGDIEPGFKIDHFLKDLAIALAEARRMRLSLPGLALAEQLYLAAQADDLGAKGTQALAVTLAKLSKRPLS